MSQQSLNLFTHTPVSIKRCDAVFCSRYFTCFYFTRICEMRELVFEGAIDRNENDRHATRSAAQIVNSGGSASEHNFSLIQKLHDLIVNGKTFYSLEFFPQDDAKLIEILQSSLGERCPPPLFCAVTWRTSVPPAADPPAVRLGAALAAGASPVVLHLAAAGLSAEYVQGVLRGALQQGITSVLLLRGDGAEGCSGGDFPHAVDLVRFVRHEFGQRLTVFVAGYPDGHPEATCYHEDLLHLKAKVRAGADAIISQVVFDAERFARFMRDCRSIGIHVPILPGVMLIVSYKSLQRAAHVCKFRVPLEVLAALEHLSGDDDAAQEYGLSYTTSLVRQLLSLGCAPGVHFFTLNRPRLAVDVWLRLCSTDAARPSQGVCPQATSCHAVPTPPVKGSCGQASS